MAKRAASKRAANSHFRDNYAEIRAEAQRLANELGFDYGIERNAFGFQHHMLTRRENRYGSDINVEVVSCEDMSRCQPGHGPSR